MMKKLEIQQNTCWRNNLRIKKVGETAFSEYGSETMKIIFSFSAAHIEHLLDIIGSYSEELNEFLVKRY